MSIKSTVYAKTRKSTTGAGTYTSGWIMKSELLALANGDSNEAVGFNVKQVKTDKFEGAIIELNSFKLKPKA